jgi:lipopolysaccharide biosynthesis glycosyltransferase
MKHIAIAIDANPGFLQQTGVMLFSLIKHNTDAITLHILHTPEAKEAFQIQRELISHFVGTTEVTLQYYEVSWKSIKSLGLTFYNNLPLTTYFRLLLPKILAEDIEVCLYLDGDMLIRGSIDPLFSLTASTDWRVAAVMTNVLTTYMDNLNLSRYFNAGVLLMNLKAWRNNNVSSNIINFIVQYPNGLKGTQPIMGDQCGINYVCNTHISVLEPIWNTTPLWFNPDYMDKPLAEQLSYFGYDNNQILQAQQNPIILHFAGINKPCNWICVHPRKMEYYRYLFESGLIKKIDFVKVVWHMLTYPLRMDRKLFQLIKKLRNIVIK